MITKNHTTIFTPGMKVLIHPRQVHAPYAFGVVGHVSATGRLVVLADGRKFTGDGYEWGRASRMYYERIESLTDEVRARIANKQAELVEQQRCKDLRYEIERDIRNLSAADLQHIADLITELRTAK